MKKFLFTLCAVLVGFAANADGLSLRVVDNSGAPCTEVHAKAGDVINMHIELTALDGIVTGLQMQYYMKGNGTTVYDPENGPVVIAKVGGSYLRKEGMSNLNGNAMANNLNPVDSEWGAYRIVCTNTTLNMFWLTDPQPVADWLHDDVTALFEDYDPPYTNAMFTLGNVIAFRVKVNSGWEDEYAVFDFDEAFTKFSGLQNQQIADEGMSLKIINDDYAPAVTLAAPTISFDQTDDTHMTVTVACETAGSTLKVNGEAVEGNPYTYVVTRPDVYTAMTVNVTAQSVLGEETSAEVTGSQAFVPVEDQPTAAKPEITFVETKNANNEVTQVVVKIENWTSATINGEEFTNGRGDVKTFTANYVAEQPIHVEAVNAPGYPYITNDNAADYTLNKLAPIASEAATFNVTMDDEFVYVTATGPGVVLYDQNGNVVDPQPLKLPRNEYSEENTGYTVNIHATTQQQGEQGQYTQTDTPYQVTVPNKAKPDDPQPTEKTPMPAFHGSTTDGIHAYFMEIDDINEDAVIYYQVYKDGVLVTDETHPDGWFVYDDKLSFTENGNYRIVAYAVAPGMLPSDTIATEFVVSETTGLVDVMNGKTVSNVRYFNMAGQEMQEANGMTIVVTTYTDGTSSAVKVMK
jgi:hypothetical protein